MGEIPEAESRASEALKAAVDRLLRRVAGPGPVKERQSVRRALREGAPEAAVLDAELEHLATQADPALQSVTGIGTVTSAQLPIVAGENAYGLKSEASFAAL